MIFFFFFFLRCLNWIYVFEMIIKASYKIELVV